MSEADTEPNKTRDDIEDEDDENDEEDEDVDSSTTDGDHLVDLEEEVEEEVEDDFDGFAADVQSAMDIARGQRAKGNSEFVQKFVDAHGSIRTLVQEVNLLRNQRTMPRTWAAWKHPATMYYH